MITILGANWCPACVRIKGEIEELGVPYSYIEIPTGESGWDIVESMTGKRSIPQLFYYIGGTKDFQEVLTELKGTKE